MHIKKILEKLAYLEFVNDQLSTELQYVDRLLRAVGFSDGLSTVKQAAQELCEDEKGIATQEDRTSVVESC